MSSPWDDPSDPLPPLPPAWQRVENYDARDAWFERSRARRTAWLQTPNGLAYQRAEAEREAVERARQALDARRLNYARARLPDSADVAEVALAAKPALDTTALRAFSDGVAWAAAVHGSPNTPGRKPRGAVRVVGGGVGSGKTCAMARALAGSPVSLFVEARTIARTPDNGYSTNVATWATWLGAPLLGIDDMGAEAGDPTAFTGLLTQRYDRGLLTLATTNLPMADFVARYVSDARLASRLRNGQGHGGAETGLAWYVVAREPDLRDPAARAAHGGGAS